MYDSLQPGRMVELLMERTCRYGVLRVLYGDIWKQEADVMVAPANNRLSGREGVDADLHRAAGEELRLACREIAVGQRKLNLPPCPVGTAVRTDPFALPAKHVIHVVGPDCRRPNQNDDRRELLPVAYQALFDQILALGDIETVAAPPLSMGVFVYPHREGAKMTFASLLGWLDTDENCVKEYMMLVRNKPFISNMRTVYRETEDQFPGMDTTE